MTLLNDFFYIRELELLEEEIHAVLKINPDHQILMGHFPGFPVVPGVCMMQMAREVFEQVKGAVRITQGETMKFLALLNAGQHPTVKLNITFKELASEYAITANLFSSESENGSVPSVTFFKFKGLYRLD